MASQLFLVAVAALLQSGSPGAVVGPGGASGPGVAAVDAGFAAAPRAPRLVAAAWVEPQDAAEARQKDDAGAVRKPAALGPDWKQFSPPDKSFTTYFPGTPTAQKVAQSTPAGPMDATLYVQKQGDTLYIAMATLTPGGAVLQGKDEDDFFASYKSSSLASMQATAKTERKTKLQGYPGLELTADIPARPGTNFPNGGSYKARCYLADGRRIFSIAVATSKDAPMSKVTDGFFEAFHINAGDPNVQAPRAADSKTGVVADPDRPGWFKVTSSAGGYSITMPGAPVETTNKINLPNVGQIDMHIALVNKGPTISYGLIYNDYPPGAFPVNDVEKGYDGARQGALANTRGGTLAEEKKMKVSGLPGREIKINLPEATIPGGGLMQIRYVAKGTRLYQVMVVAPKAEFKNEDVDTFMDSFKITTK